MKCKCGEEFEPMYRNGLLMSKLCIPCLVAKGNSKRKKDWRKEKSEIKEKLKTKSDWLNELQKEINTIVRLIDKGTFCHSTELKLNDKSILVLAHDEIIPLSGSESGDAFGFAPRQQFIRRRSGISG